jgi:predicted HTH transcriptional regulator
VPGDPIDGLTAATIQSGEHVAASMRRNPIFAEYLSRMHRLRGGTSDMFPGVGTGVHFVVRRAIVAAGGTLTYRSEPGAVIVTVTAPP